MPRRRSSRGLAQIEAVTRTPRIAKIVLVLDKDRSPQEILSAFDIKFEAQSRHYKCFSIEISLAASENDEAINIPVRLQSHIR